MDRGREAVHREIFPKIHRHEYDVPISAVREFESSIDSMIGSDEGSRALNVNQHISRREI